MDATWLEAARRIRERTPTVHGIGVQLPCADGEVNSCEVSIGGWNQRIAVHLSRGTLDNQRHRLFVRRPHAKAGPAAGIQCSQLRLPRHVTLPCVCHARVRERGGIAGFPLELTRTAAAIIVDRLEHRRQTAREQMVSALQRADAQEVA